MVATMYAACLFLFFLTGLWKLVTHGHLRETGLESTVPLPKLIDTTLIDGGKVMKLSFQNMGLDASKDAAITSNKRWNDLKAKSVQELVDAGLAEHTLSPHKKNWCLLTPHGSAVPRLYLIDHGRVCLSKKALRETSARRAAIWREVPAGRRVA